MMLGGYVAGWEAEILQDVPIGCVPESVGLFVTVTFENLPTPALPPFPDLCDERVEVDASRGLKVAPVGEPDRCVRPTGVVLAVASTASGDIPAAVQAAAWGESLNG